MAEASALYPRRSAERVHAALADTRVVVLNGARQTGKSTLARLVAQVDPHSEIRYLDDATRSAADADPAAFVRHDGLLIIDEVQRVPDLILAIKHAVDLDPRPGRYLLTGSARLFALRQIPDLLPGRAETIELWPLSQGEIGRTREVFVETVFDDGPDLHAPVIENFVLSELARQLTWTDEPIRLYHYRDRDGYEVDAVLEHASGEVVAIGVKAAETVRSDDFRGIRHLAQRVGERFVAGIVLHAGTQVLPFGNRLRALPISTLWAA